MIFIDDLINLWNWKKYNIEIYNKNKIKGRKQKHEQKEYLVSRYHSCHCNYQCVRSLTVWVCVLMK